MSNWISVDERLPRLRTDVIVHLRDVTEPDVSGTVVPLIFGLEGCIEFLKSKGYRVMKPVNEWVEI